MTLSFFPLERLVNVDDNTNGIAITLVSHQNHLGHEVLYVSEQKVLTTWSFRATGIFSSTREQRITITDQYVFYS